MIDPKLAQTLAKVITNLKKELDGPWGELTHPKLAQLVKAKYGGEISHQIMVKEIRRLLADKPEEEDELDGVWW